MLSKTLTSQILNQPWISKTRYSIRNIFSLLNYMTDPLTKAFKVTSTSFLFSFVSIAKYMKKKRKNIFFLSNKKQFKYKRARKTLFSFRIKSFR